MTGVATVLILAAGAEVASVVGGRGMSAGFTGALGFDGGGEAGRGLDV